MNQEKEARSTLSDKECKEQQKMGENSNSFSEETEERAANIKSQTLHMADQLKEDIDRKIQQPQR